MKTNLLRTGIICSFLAFGIVSANAQVNPMNKKDTTKHLWKDTSHAKPGMYKDTVHMKNDTPPKLGGVVPPHQIDVLLQQQVMGKKEE